jgi:AcrR family transcriptional regulator
VTSARQGTSTDEARSATREARAARILDAAATLILRYGAHKITIEEIASEAEVGKGTIYLHWKTRDALFAALILREKLAMAEDIQHRIAHDPADATLRGLLKHAALALMHRPVLKAVLLRDTEAFGRVAEREQGSATSAEVLAGFTTYLQSLREQGLVRTDLSLRTLAALFGSIFLGFFLAAPLLPDAFRLADEELAELMAEAGHRALEPRDPASPEALEFATHALAQHLDRSMATAHERSREDAMAQHDHDRLHAHRPSRARGRGGGRAKKLSTAAAVAEARRLYADKSRSIAEICAALGISRATLYRYLKDTKEENV